MTKDEALKMCLEYIETNAHERRLVRWAIKEALAQSLPVQPEQDLPTLERQLAKAYADMEKADADLDKANGDWTKACADLDKADAEVKRIEQLIKEQTA